MAACWEADGITLPQHKRITELHASLALPLVANASLAFLKRHLALSAPQHELIDEAVAANSVRLEAFDSALAKAEAEVRYVIHATSCALSRSCTCQGPGVCKGRVCKVPGFKCSTRLLDPPQWYFRADIAPDRLLLTLFCPCEFCWPCICAAPKSGLTYE